MSFIWPPALLLLALLPIGALGWREIARRRRLAVAAYGSLGLRPHASPGLRGLAPPAFALVGLAIIVVALARPQAVLSLPRLEGTVILAFDVSGSMAATDFSPTRMEAAKAAARAFVEKQPPTVQIGVVAFSDSGVAVQAATNDQGDILAAIDRLAPQRGTSLAGGIEASLKAIATAENPTAGYYTNRSFEPTPSPVPPGTHSTAVVVLLSDGENNESPDPLAAAQAAAAQGIRIDTVGIGSPGGTTVDIEGFRVHTQLDAALLQQIARTTDGTYFAAADQEHLDSVYSNLDTSVIVKPEATEVTSVFAAAGVAALVLACVTSLLWLGRAP